MAFHSAPAPPLRFSIVSCDAAATFEMDANCMARLDRFRDRIGCTLGNRNMMKAWEDELLPATFTVGDSLAVLFNFLSLQHYPMDGLTS